MAKQGKLVLPARSLHITFMCIIIFTVDYVAMTKNTGAYFKAVYTSSTKQVQEKQPLSHLQTYLHRCSMNSNCNFVVEDLKNAIKMHNAWNEVPYDEELLGIWMKVPRPYVYRVYMEKLTWHDARAKCMLHGGDLASISSTDEKEMIRKLLSNFSNAEWLWIGLNDIEKEAKFVWSDGSAYIDSDWGANEPNGNTIENCVFSDKSMQWYDNACSYQLFFICKIPLYA